MHVANIYYLISTGIQHHLGFHHANSHCSGHIKLADCHYLSSSLNEKVLGSYYLGCPMTEGIKSALTQLFSSFPPYSNIDSTVNKGVTKVRQLMYEYKWMDYML